MFKKIKTFYKVFLKYFYLIINLINRLSYEINIKQNM